MFINDRNAITITADKPVGAAMDFSEVNQTEALMIASGVVGAGVLGTSLMVAAYVAPLPIIGGTVVALGCVTAATMLGNEDDLVGSDKSDKVSVMPKDTETTAESRQYDVDKAVETPPITTYDGVEVSPEDL